MDRRAHRVAALVAIVLTLTAMTSDFSPAIAASVDGIARTAHFRARPVSAGAAVARQAKKKNKKHKTPASLMSKLRHVGGIAVVLAVVGLGLFLVGSGVRGPRGRKRRRRRP